MNTDFIVQVTSFLICGIIIGRTGATNRFFYTLILIVIGLSVANVMVGAFHGSALNFDWTLVVMVAGWLIGLISVSKGNKNV